MTIGLGAFAFAPGAAPAGRSASAGSLGSRSPITSRSFFESGDQSYEVSRPLTSVNCCASPPLRSSSHTWLPLTFPGRLDRNDSQRPSGLQRGALSLSVLVVMRKCCLPSQLVIQTSVSLLSAVLSTVLSVYATHFPSGEIWASRTSWKRCMSSIFSARRAGWAKRRDAGNNTAATQKVLVRIMGTPSLSTKRQPLPNGRGSDSTSEPRPLGSDFPGNTRPLERVPQRELHLARRTELAAQFAEGGGGGQAVGGRRRVEADSVGNVVSFPAE